MSSAAHHPPRRHGRVLRVGRAARRSVAARPAGDRRRPPRSAASSAPRRTRRAAFGVRSAMPMARRAPALPRRRLPCRRGFERYAELSERVFAIFRRYTPLVEPLSLDEAFLDVTASRALFGDGRGHRAARSRRAVRGECGLTVSAGVAHVQVRGEDRDRPRQARRPRRSCPGRRRARSSRRSRSSGCGASGRDGGGARARSGIAHDRRPRRDAGGARSRRRSARRTPATSSALARGEDPRDVVPDEAARSIGAEETFERGPRRRARRSSRELLAQAGRVARRLRAAGARRAGS